MSETIEKLNVHYRLWSSRLHCRNLCCQSKTCLSFISEFNPGGQLTTTTNEVENFQVMSMGYRNWNDGSVTNTNKTLRELMFEMAGQLKPISGDIHKVWINGKEIHCKGIMIFQPVTAISRTTLEQHYLKWVVVFCLCYLRWPFYKIKK
jgi:hypothetical protein